MLVDERHSTVEFDSHRERVGKVLVKKLDGIWRSDSVVAGSVIKKKDLTGWSHSFSDPKRARRI